MLRTVVGRLGAGFGLAAALAAGGTSYALCDSDTRGPSFDPEALERGAKALREINASPYAKKVHPRKTCGDMYWTLSKFHTTTVPTHLGEGALNCTGSVAC